MAEKPILFSAPMVAAILAGRKTQTRRVIRLDSVQYDTDGAPSFEDKYGDHHDAAEVCPYGKSGDFLWVRESFKLGQAPGDEQGQGIALYSDGSHKCHPDLDAARLNWCRQWKPRPSIFMPRWASRLTLKIAGIRTQRLQDISEDDAKTEGVTAWHDTGNGTVYRPEFAMLWDTINRDRGFSWASNPFVWVIGFEIVEAARAS